MRISLTILAMTAGLCLAGCHQGRDSALHDGVGQSASPGALKWKITEAATGKVLGEGEKKVTASEITSEKVAGGEVGTLIKQTIHIGAHFRLSLAQTESGANDQGFGLTVDKDDEPAFSWEWFNVDRPGHATKLQESGELGFETDNGRIVRIKFLTDVSLRVIPMTGSPDPLNPKWRVEIAKGSEIAWPRG
ncbi:MAG: hypothetical protein ACHQ50_08640 [Fimbriimonadales bacterium]